MNDYKMLFEVSHPSWVTKEYEDSCESWAVDRYMEDYARVLPVRAGERFELRVTCREFRSEKTIVVVAEQVWRFREAR